MGKKSPCKTCTKRAPHCHGKCKEYNEWHDEHVRIMEGEKATMPITIHQSQFLGTKMPDPKTHKIR